MRKDALLFAFSAIAAANLNGMAGCSGLFIFGVPYLIFGGDS